MFNYTYRKRLFIFSLFHCAIIGLYANSPLSHTPCHSAENPTDLTEKKKEIRKKTITQQWINHTSHMHKQHPPPPSPKQKKRKKNPECHYKSEGDCEVCSAWDEDIHKEQLKGRLDWWSGDIIQWAVYGPSTRRNVSVVLSLRQHEWRPVSEH